MWAGPPSAVVTANRSPTGTASLVWVTAALRRTARLPMRRACTCRVGDVLASHSEGPRPRRSPAPRAGTRLSGPPVARACGRLSGTTSAGWWQGDSATARTCLRIGLVWWRRHGRRLVEVCRCGASRRGARVQCPGGVSAACRVTDASAAPETSTDSGRSQRGSPPADVAGVSERQSASRPPRRRRCALARSQRRS